MSAERRWQYNDPEFDEDGRVIDNKIVTVTDSEIIASYWDHWCGLMRKAGHIETMITRENCIDDFVVVNWAWELSDGDEPPTCASGPTASHQGEGQET